MPIKMPRRDWTALRATGLLASICLAGVTATPVLAEDPRGELETVLIGYLAPPEPPLDSIVSVRMSFEVFELGAPQELFTLKVFDVGFEEEVVSEAVQVAEEIVKVDGIDPLQPNEIWIGQPPAPMQWIELTLAEPLIDTSGNLLFAIELQPSQLLWGSALLPHIEKECGEPRSYFSIDGGATWDPLTVEELACLGQPTCEDNGSTNLRINVQPC
ncbi:MAG: hypothetical protein AAF657_13115 [Acidobacteriota bacterium]